MTDTTEIAEVAPTSFGEALKQVEPFSTAPFPYTELQERWLFDLVTTAPHWQGTGRLLHIPMPSPYTTGQFDANSGGFCCLGRACVVAGATVKLDAGSPEIKFVYGDDENDAFLPESLADEIQMNYDGAFRGDEGESGIVTVTIPGFGRYSGLTHMNDAGGSLKRLTFRQIAAFIRHDPWRVFAKAPLPETASIEATA